MTVKTIATILWLLITIAATGAVPTQSPDLSRITAIPSDYYDVVVNAYRSLPPRLQKALLDHHIEATFKNGDALGAAFAAGHMGESLDTQSTYVRWPIGAETVSFPWGAIRLIDATRHELAHLALERIFGRSSEIWTQIIKAIQEEEGDDFFREVAAGHKNATNLRSSSAMASYESLHEYLASLAEHCGKPIRAPLPSGRARPMVEALMSGGTC